jgi:hypothetical protein
MASLKAMAEKLFVDSSKAELLAFNLMEIEDAGRAIACDIQKLREIGDNGGDPRRVNLIRLLAHFMHFRGHERNARKLLDAAVDQMDTPDEDKRVANGSVEDSE